MTTKKNITEILKDLIEALDNNNIIDTEFNLKEKIKLKLKEIREKSKKVINETLKNAIIGYVEYVKTTTIFGRISFENYLEKEYSGLGKQIIDDIKKEVKLGVNERIKDHPLLSKINFSYMSSGSNEYKKLKFNKNDEYYYNDNIISDNDVQNYIIKSIYAKNDLYMPAIYNVAIKDLSGTIVRGIIRSIINFTYDKVINGLQTKAIRGILNSPTKKVVYSTATAVKDITKKDLLKFINSIDDIYLKNNDLAILCDKDTYYILKNDLIELGLYKNVIILRNYSLSNTVCVALPLSQYNLFINEYIDEIVLVDESLLYKTLVGGGLLNEDACAILQLS